MPISPHCDVHEHFADPFLPQELPESITTLTTHFTGITRQHTNSHPSEIATERTAEEKPSRSKSTTQQATYASICEQLTLSSKLIFTHPPTEIEMDMRSALCIHAEYARYRSQSASTCAYITVRYCFL